MRHVYRTQIPVFVDEEIDYVDEVEEVDQPHRIGHVSDLLILVRGVRNGNQRPSDYARPSVVEELEIPEFAEARVQFYACEIVEDE